jgi:hypothetical protein
MENVNQAFRSLSAKQETVKMIGIIAATEDSTVYAIVDKAVRATFPKYYQN